MKWLTGLNDAVLAADEAAQKALDLLLQATADMADANYEVFKALPQVIGELSDVSTQHCERTHPVSTSKDGA